jgi:hypothetical protein
MSLYHTAGHAVNILAANLSSLLSQARLGIVAFPRL